MRTIYQPDRVLLALQVQAYSDLLHGIVLNLGCGAYDRYSYFFKRVRAFVHIDIHSNNLTTLVGDAHNLPFKDAVFDGILCTQVLEHLYHPEQAFREMARVLKSKGVAIITVPQTNELHEEPFDYFRFTKYALIHLAEKSGFELIACESRGGFFTCIAQAIIRYLIERMDAYRRSFPNRLVWLAAHMIGRVGIWLDNLDKSNANRKFTLGWTVVVRKKTL